MNHTAALKENVDILNQEKDRANAARLENLRKGREILERNRVSRKIDQEKNLIKNILEEENLTVLPSVTGTKTLAIEEMDQSQKQEDKNRQGFTVTPVEGATRVNSNGQRSQNVQGPQGTVQPVESANRNSFIMDIGGSFIRIVVSVFSAWLAKSFIESFISNNGSINLHNSDSPYVQSPSEQKIRKPDEFIPGQSIYR